MNILPPPQSLAFTYNTCVCVCESLISVSTPPPLTYRQKPLPSHVANKSGDGPRLRLPTKPPTLPACFGEGGRHDARVESGTEIGRGAGDGDERGSNRPDVPALVFDKTLGRWMRRREVRPNGLRWFMSRKKDSTGFFPRKFNLLGPGAVLR